MTLEIMSDKQTGDSELFLYIDDKGFEILQSAIDRAKKSGHEHLLSREWGGKELSVSDNSSRSFHKLTIEFLSK